MKINYSLLILALIAGATIPAGSARALVGHETTGQITKYSLTNYAPDGHALQTWTSSQPPVFKSRGCILVKKADNGHDVTVCSDHFVIDVHTEKMLGIQTK